MSTVTIDTRIANTILEQIGFLSRACLDMKTKNIQATNNGFIAHDVLVTTGPNRRGTIVIELNHLDLYDVRFTLRNNKEVEYNDLSASQLHELFGQISGSAGAGHWNTVHTFN